ncbi:MAG: hypothetical protein ABF270_03905, partial [Flavobacteriales bacterium]
MKKLIILACALAVGTTGMSQDLKSLKSKAKAEATVGKENLQEAKKDLKEMPIEKTNLQEDLNAKKTEVKQELKDLKDKKSSELKGMKDEMKAEMDAKKEELKADIAEDTAAYKAELI